MVCTYVNEDFHYHADITLGLVAGLSGLRTTVRSLQHPMSEAFIAALRSARQMYTGLIAFAGGHFPPAAVFASRIISPTVFAATFQYQSMVCAIPCTSSKYASHDIQTDMAYMVNELPGRYADMPLPRINAPTILAYISPSRGFGVFAAADIPKDRGESTDENPPSSPLCVGTYGGVVCTDKEVKKPNYAYQMPCGSLPPHRGRQSIE